jgi:hypothetical protein
MWNLNAELRFAGQPKALVSTQPLLTKVAGKLIAIFLRLTSCQCRDVYPSILTESRPAGLVMAVTDF